MGKDEIKVLILKRAYAGAFVEGVSDTFNLNDLAKENQIDNDVIWKVFDELKEDDLIKSWAMGGIIAPTSRGLLYCEDHKLVEGNLIELQNHIRTKLLVAIANLQEKSPHGAFFDWEAWIAEAGVNKQDFFNNEKILRDFGLVEKKTIRGYVITYYGMEKVNEYRKKVARLKAFEDLESLTGMTPQQRGHKLEDLLAEIAKDEGWEVDKRVRAQGQEIDIIIHKGLHYFMISCKWEGESVQAHEVELLESRVRSRAGTTGGMLFSMSGFTDNCVDEAKFKISSAMILLFGEVDIKEICGNHSTLTNLFEEKYDEAMQHRKIHVDGKAK
jgi:hypothetical protein